MKLGWKALKYAFSGYNASIFAYGQTGSGKSHSMIGTENDPGLIRRIGDFLFDFIQRGEEELGLKYKATVSACEIYCENVRDLLSFMNNDAGPGRPGAGAKSQPPKRSTSMSMRSMLGGTSKMERMKREMAQGAGSDIVDNVAGGQSLKIREGPGGVYVEGQSSVEVRSMAEMGGIIFAAIENRMVRATSMNADSSRSHLIFVINFTQTQTSPATGRQTVTKSKINMIDLAGSERARTTGVSGEGLREGANINKSLSTLGRVISTLAEGKTRDHVPYRDSKLTYILKDSLGGDSKTAMLATISPSEVNYEETVSTLRYAASVKRIKTSASQHLEQEAGEMIEKLKAEVDALATELKNQEIQAAALAEEHRRAMEDLEKARPVKVVRDDKELAKLKAELANMSKRAERYRGERDTKTTALGAMEKRAERYRQERKVAEERVKALEKDLAKAEKASASKPTSGSEPSSPKTPPQSASKPGGLVMSPEEAAAASVEASAKEAEVARLLSRVRELEELVSSNAGMNSDMQTAIKSRRENGSHLSRMSQELQDTAAEKAKLEQKLKRKSEQLRDPMAVMSMGFTSMFGALAAVPSQDDENSDDATDEDDGGSAIVSLDGTHSLDPRAGFTRKASTLRRSAEKTLAAASGDASLVPGVVVDSLRHQLEESNAMNEALEQKVHDQHAKLLSVTKHMAELQAQDDTKSIGDGSETGGKGMSTAEKERLESERAELLSEKRSLEAKAKAEAEARKAVEKKLADAEEAELSLRAAKDELLAAKDLVEDELRASHAAAAEDLRIVNERAEKAEASTVKLEKQKAKLERDMEKLQKRHAELRVASKRLLAEKLEKKAEEEGGAPAEPGSPRTGKSPTRNRSPKRTAESAAAAAPAAAAATAPAASVPAPTAAPAAAPAPAAAAAPAPVERVPSTRGRSPPPKPAASDAGSAARPRSSRSISPRAAPPPAPKPAAAAASQLPPPVKTTPAAAPPVVDLAATSNEPRSRSSSPRAGRGSGAAPTPSGGRGSGGRSPRSAAGGRGGRGEASGRGGRGGGSPRSAQVSIDLAERTSAEITTSQTANADVEAKAAVAKAEATAPPPAASAAAGDDDGEAKKKAERAQKLKDARLKAAALKEQKQAQIARASRESERMEAAE